MAGASDTPVPVWGIEVGSDSIRAARVVRRAEGGFYLLDRREAVADSPGPDGLLAFLRKNGLTGHPLVVALRTPTSHMASAATSPEDEIYGPEDLRGELMEFVHPEPDEIEFGYVREQSGSYLVLSEERTLVESYIGALEAAELPAYALVSSLDAIVSLVRRNNLFEGDGLLVCMDGRFTNLLFLDGRTVTHLALPIGSEDLENEGARDALRSDLERLIDYHRLQESGDRPVKMAVLGVGEETARTVADLLPERPTPFPADAGPIRGKGRITLMQALETIRETPAAVGAAIAGAASPRRLELAFRKLPDELPQPTAGIGRWVVAAALLWIALGAAWFGVHRGLEDLRAAKAESRPIAGTQDAASARRLEKIVENARRALAFPRAVAELCSRIPGTGEGVLLTRSITLRSTPGGAYEVSADYQDGGIDRKFTVETGAGR